MASVKPCPDMNTQLLLEIQEQNERLRLLMGDLKMEVKVEIRSCKRALDQCRIAFEECKKGYHDIRKSYEECAKGFDAISEKCEDLEDTFMSCSDGSGGGMVLNV